MWPWSDYDSDAPVTEFFGSRSPMRSPKSMTELVPAQVPAPKIMRAWDYRCNGGISSNFGAKATRWTIEAFLAPRGTRQLDFPASGALARVRWTTPRENPPSSGAQRRTSVSYLRIAEPRKGARAGAHRRERGPSARRASARGKGSAPPRGGAAAARANLEERSTTSTVNHRLTCCQTVTGWRSLCLADVVMASQECSELGKEFWMPVRWL